MKGFKNVEVYYGDRLQKTDLVFENLVMNNFGGEFEEIKLPQGAIVVPAFIDEHIHGVKGFDTMDASIDALSNMSEALLSEGTVAYLPTTMTQSEENITAALENVKRYKSLKADFGADVIGVHLEGPYISPAFIGAQPPKYVVAPDIEQFEKYNNLSGNNIKIVTVAPEVDGAAEFISYLKSRGIIASAGHTAARHSDILRAIDAGLSQITHTYNAQSPLHHRDIGTVGCALYYDNLGCELICDKIHVSPEAIKLLIKSKPHDKVMLITDAMRAKQMPDGLSELGGQKVIVKKGEARLENGALAGSVLKMNDAVKNLVSIGVSFTDAIDFASKNPAKNLGLYNERGSIEQGKRADFAVLLDFEVIMTVKAGKVVYKAF